MEKGGLFVSLVNTKEMFQKAYEGGHAVGAFPVNNMEIVQGITEACEETRICMKEKLGVRFKIRCRIKQGKTQKKHRLNKNYN